MAYELKKFLDDFRVTEILKTDLKSEKPTNILLYKLIKKNYTTERAVQQIARTLRIPRRNISYAGVKDKQAITTQYITIKGVSKQKLDSLILKDIELSFESWAIKELKLGDLEGNKFEIVLRNVSTKPLQAPESFVVPNYFDEQRFSSKNVEIGLNIIKNNFKEAINIIINNDKDYSEILKDYLLTHENDYVGALKRIPRKIILFYMHSVQSMLFNKELSRQIKEEFKEIQELSLPFGRLIFPKKIISQQEEDSLRLVGWDSVDSQDLKELGIVPRQLIIRSIPELSLEESLRPKYSLVTEFTMKKEDSNKYYLAFALKKGSYATIVVKYLFGI